MPESSYAAVVESAKRIPEAKALSFFLSADRLDETHVWTYAELVADITRAANLFTLLGVAADRPAAFVLPNLPETHFTIWGGEAAGAALAINPMLEPKLIANLLRSVRASVLVTMAPALNPTTWSVLAARLPSLSDLRTVAFVDMADYIDHERRAAARASIEGAAGTGLKVLNLRQAMREQPSDRLTSAARFASTRSRPTSAPVGRRAPRRLRCGRIGTKFSTRGPPCKQPRPTVRGEPFSAACPCFT